MVRFRLLVQSDQRVWYNEHFKISTKLTESKLLTAHVALTALTARKQGQHYWVQWAKQDFLHTSKLHSHCAKFYSIGAAWYLSEFHMQLSAQLLYSDATEKLPSNSHQTSRTCQAPKSQMPVRSVAWHMAHHTKTMSFLIVLLTNTSVDECGSC